MLYELQIENIAVIKKAIITFSKGFNVMTGETGAGKSIVIDSINAVLGERTSRELIRTGSDAAVVSALFYDRSDSFPSFWTNWISHVRTTAKSSFSESCLQTVETPVKSTEQR